MSENKRLSERNAKIAAMLSDGEQLKNFYRFIAQTRISIFTMRVKS